MLWNITLVLLAMVCASPAWASKTVTSPSVREGEFSAEWKSEYIFDDDDNRQGAWKQKFVAAYGFTDFWQSEIETNISRGGRPSDDTVFSNVDWKNKFQFTRQGPFWLDTGMRLTYGFSGTGGPDEVEAKFLAGRNCGATAHRANLIITRELGEDSDNAVEWGLSWSSRYKYSSSFEPGFELHSIFGEIGNEDGFDTQDHRIGPVFYGKFGESGLSYDAGYLFGISESAPEGTVKAIIKYKW